MILSDGALLKSPTIMWQGTTAEFTGWPSRPSASPYLASYSTMYREQIWVTTVINKLAYGEARLPYKVYERDDLNRIEVPNSPYGQLMANPCPGLPRFFWWLWLISTFDIFGEAFLGKLRDAGGRPAKLVPLHPMAMHLEEVDGDGVATWSYQTATRRYEGITDHDLVHPRTYNPDSIHRGLSRLEPLRRTLEFEDAAQRAQSSFWRRGARPGVALKHPGSLSQAAADRLKVQWDQLSAGADMTGTSVVLEEGMSPEVLTIANDEAQYIDSRRLNREEVCGAYDVPPPAVHILDRATFTNITEQLRSLYRDTHAPRLRLFEDCFEAELRGSVRPGASEPDFSDDVYGEFLLDEVLRGDWEARSAGYQTAINAGWLTPAEVRKLENLPFVEGSDQLLINSAIVPLDQSDAEALPTAALRMLMGRLGRVTDVASIDPALFVAGLDRPEPVVRALDSAVFDGDDLDGLKARLRKLTLGGGAQ